jgi:hypothetical protein
VQRPNICVMVDSVFREQPETGDLLIDIIFSASVRFRSKKVDIEIAIQKPPILM